MSQPLLYPASERSDLTSRYSECAFHFRGSDCRLLSVGGDVLLFTRASKAWALGADLRWREVNYGVERWVPVDTDGDGVFDDCGVLIESGFTNAVKGSENVGGADWTNFSTTATLAVATSGALTFSRIADTSAVSSQYLIQNLTLTGFVNALPAVLSFHIKAPSVIGANGAAVGVFDNVASAYRVNVTISWSGTGPTAIPSVIGGVGNLLSVTPLADGVWRVVMVSVGLTIANSHTLYVFPANSVTPADMGDIVIGGVMLTTGSMPSSHIVSPIGTQYFRGQEYLTAPSLWDVIDAETWYVKTARPPWWDIPAIVPLTNANGGINAFLLSRGPINPSMSIYGLCAVSQRCYTATMNDSAGTQAIPTANVAPAFAPPIHELCAEFSLMGSTPRVRIDAGAGYGAYSPQTLLPVVTGSPATTWASAMTIGDATWGPGDVDMCVILSVKIQRAARTMAQMREAW